MVLIAPYFQSDSIGPKLLKTVEITSFLLENVDYYVEIVH